VTVREKVKGGERKVGKMRGRKGRKREEGARKGSRTGGWINSVAGLLVPRTQLRRCADIIAV